MPADRRSLVRNLFLRLTETGEGAEDTRRRVAVEELVPEGASPEEVHELLDRLAEARLVTLGQGTAEVAHEVLIREWPTLRAWLEEDRAGIRLQRRLGDAARLWEAGTREAADLYRGTRLAAALEWAQSHPDELNAGERAFLDASVAESERERRSQIRANRRLRVLLGGVGLLLVAAVIAGVLALRAGERARDTARTADAQRLGAQALVDDRLERSLLLAQAGRVLDDSVATRGNLLSALVRHPAAVGVLRGGTGAVFALALSPDGRTLAAGDDAGSVVLIDTRTRERIGRPLMLDREVWEIGFSPDGRLLVVTSGVIGTGVDAHSVKLLDTASMRLVREIDVGRVPGAADKIVDARFDATGRAVIATVASNSPAMPFPTQLRRYDVRTGRPIGRAVRIAGSNAIPTECRVLAPDALLGRRRRRPGRSVDPARDPARPGEDVERRALAGWPQRGPRWRGRQRPHPRSRDGEAPDPGRSPRGSGPGARVQLRRPHAGDQVRRRPGADLGSARGQRARDADRPHRCHPDPRGAAPTDARSTRVAWTSGSSSGIWPATGASPGRSRSIRSSSPASPSSRRRSRSARPAGSSPREGRTAA